MAVVITGDVISSSRLALTKRQLLLNQLLKESFAVLRNVWRLKTQMRAEIIQGDAFQVYVLDNAEAIRAAFLIKCFWLSQDKVGNNYRFDCRLSIGIGAVALLDADSLAKSGGDVFTYSGRGLKEISRTGPQLRFKAPNADWSAAINVALALADELLGRYTPAQAQALLLKLIYPRETQAKLAKRLEISRSAYSQRLGQAGWPAVEALLTYYSKTTES